MRKRKLALALILAAILGLLLFPTESFARTVSSPSKYYVNCPGAVLNVRTKPNTTTSKVVGTLPHGSSITVLYLKNKNWAAVRYKSKVRYVSFDFLSETKPYVPATPTVQPPANPSSFPATYRVSIQDGFLNIRNKPTLVGSKVVKTVKNGKKLKVLYFVDNEWAAIQLGSKVRFVSRQFIVRK